MEQKPEGTPNPLNPNLESAALDANPSEPMQEVAPAPRPPRGTGIIDMVKPTNAAPRPVVPEPQPATAVTEPATPTVEPVAPTMEPTTPASAPQTTTPAMGVVTEVDPTNRPMQKALSPEQIAAQTQPKKKKKGPIIAAIACLVVALVCVVAAVAVLMNGNKKSPVAIAAERVVNREAPDNIDIDGEINIDINDANSPFFNLRVNLSTEAVSSSLINSTTARLNASMRNGGSFSMELGEIYAANGDLYLRLDGIGEILDATSLAETLASLEMLDGEWIRIPMEQMNSILPEGSTSQSELSCMVGLAADLNSNNNTVQELYRKYPFVTGTDEDLSVTSERDPIYRVIINQNAYIGFTDGLQNANALTNWNSCLGENSTDNSLSDPSDWPDIYVEVNDDYNFTRLYFVAKVTEADCGCSEDEQCIQACTEQREATATATVDLRFSYPANVNVPEPTEYKDLEDVMADISSAFEGLTLESGTPGEEVPFEELPDDGGELPPETPAE